LALFADGLLSEALTSEEKSDLTIHLYGLASQRGPARTELFPWERQWFEDALPAPPARVLLGAAGSGREAAWLVAAGYTVHAFEPVRRFASALRALVEPEGDAAVGSYADLVRAVAGETANPLAAFAVRNYDAVILGWGSLSHVIDKRERLDLMRCCDNLCHHGPVLASFFAISDQFQNRRTQSRAAAAGAHLGMRAAKSRGVAGRREAGDGFLAHAGFGHAFTPAELQSIARSIDRELCLELQEYPHATFARSSSSEE
jgi:hypothetical protein